MTRVRRVLTGGRDQRPQPASSGGFGVTAGDPTTPGALSLSVYVSRGYGSGYIAFAGDGTVKHINYPS